MTTFLEQMDQLHSIGDGAHDVAAEVAAHRSQQVCAIDGCGRPKDERGWCHPHYERWRKFGDPEVGGPLLSRTDTIGRFWAKVNKNGPAPDQGTLASDRGLGQCWLWTGAASKGYGNFRMGGRVDKAYRAAYTLFVGPIPEGLHLDHLCRVPSCVNPEHVEPVTPLVNVKRGVHGDNTHCKNGHPFDETNTNSYVDQYGRTHRNCRTCQAAYKRNRDQARRESA